MGKHAILSPSAAHRWLVCTPSVRLEETLPEQTSIYAEEGTLAHKVCEIKLREYTGEITHKTATNSIAKLKKDPLWNDEMLEHAGTYIDTIKDIAATFTTDPVIEAEQSLDLSKWAPESFGTADCLIFGDNKLYVIDYKYGKGVPVAAVGNVQMKLYALGAYEICKIIEPIQTIHTVIVQPRINSIPQDEIGAEELLAWGESIKAPAQAAYEGTGDYIAGEHCKFCRARAVCRARGEANLTLEPLTKKEPATYANEEIGDILTRAATIAEWYSDLKDYALQECLQGRDIPGYKAVEGRAARIFTNTDTAIEQLHAAGIQDAIIYERKMLTLAQLEKALGKKIFEETVGSLVTKQPGKPTLAPANDKRAAITASTSAAKDFKEE